MNRKFQMFPDGRFYSIQELEEVLRFRYLPHNLFESSEEQKLIQDQGFAQQAQGQLSQEQEALGERFKEQLQAAALPAVSVRWIEESIGYGLFTEQELDTGDYVGEYTGLVRKNDIRKYLAPLNNYCYLYPALDEIRRPYVIDAEQGQLTRFINHSYTPNLRSVHIFRNGFFHLVFLALHPIAKGTQLTYDYGRNYWYLRKPPLLLK